MEGRRLQVDRQQRLLLELAKLPGNATCADCGTRNPRWASHNLGIFLCVQCAGIHRKMGTHISKVKSLTLDTWNKDQVEVMKDIGNVKSNIKFNPDEMKNRLPVNVDDTERDGEIERFIRNKYERLLFCQPELRLDLKGEKARSVESLGRRKYSSETSSSQETNARRTFSDHEDVYVPRHPKDPVRRAATREYSSTNAGASQPPIPPSRQKSHTIGAASASAGQRTGTVVRSNSPSTGAARPPVNRVSSTEAQHPPSEPPRPRASTLYTSSAGHLAAQPRPPLPQNSHAHSNGAQSGVWADLAQLETGVSALHLAPSNMYTPSEPSRNQSFSGANPFLTTPTALPMSGGGIGSANYLVPNRNPYAAMVHTPLDQTTTPSQAQGQNASSQNDYFAAKAYPTYQSQSQPFASGQPWTGNITSAFTPSYSPSAYGLTSPAFLPSFHQEPAGPTPMYNYSHPR